MYVIIDIGSNTVRMAVYSINGTSFTQLMSNKVSCGLAGYIENNKMSDEGAELMIDTLKQFKIAIDGMHNINVYAIATASLRELENKELLLNKIKAETGFEIDVISGEEEAVYDYYGIMKEIGNHTGLLTDCGGGSTEVSFFNADKVIYADTMPIGSLNSYYRHVQDIFPKKSELEDIKNDTKKLLKKLKFPRDISFDSDYAYAIGGTVRATCKLANKLLSRKKNTKHLTTSEYDKLFEIYLNNQTKFIRSLLKVKPERVHTLLTGMCIQRTIMEYLGCNKIMVSESGVREGYLKSHLEGIKDRVL